MASKFDLRQSISHDTLSQLTSAAGTQADALMRNIDSEVTMPFRMSANSPANRTVNIGNVTVTNPDHARNRIIVPLDGGMPSFTSGTATLPSASGGNITNSTAGSPVVLTLSSGNFAKVGINIDVSGDLQINVGTEAASIAAAGTPAYIANTFAIGYIIAQNIGGTIQNVTNSYIYQYMGADKRGALTNPMDSEGDLIYGGVGGASTKLDSGTADYMLKANGAAAPSWALIVNANIDAAAAITYSKLSLSNSIINADINASAAIAYSKLNLSGSIVNADINASAAINYSKLTALTISRALVSDGSGFVSVSTTSTTQLQYLNAATGTTGTTSSNLVFSISPTLTTPILGVATGTSLDLSGSLTVRDDIELIGTSATAINSSSTTYRGIGNKKNSILLSDSFSLGQTYLLAGGYFDGANKYTTLNNTAARFLVTESTAVTNDSFTWAVAQSVSHLADAAATYTVVGTVNGNGLWTLGATGGTQVHQINGDVYLTDGFLISQTGTARKTYASLQISRTSNPEMLFEDIGNNTANIALIGANFIIGSDSGTPITFRTGVTFASGASASGTERMRLTAAGQFVVGNTAARTDVGNTQTPLVQVESIATSNRRMSLIHNSTGNSGPVLDLAKTKGTTAGAVTLVSAGNELGYIVFGGANGTSIRDAAYIGVLSEGTPSSTSMGSGMYFYTTQDGTLTPTVRQYIDNDGNVYFNNTADTEFAYKVNVQGTTSAAGSFYGLATSTSAGTRPSLALNHRRDTGAATYMSSGDNLGDVNFYGQGATASRLAVSIEGFADAAWSSGNYPGRLSIYTTATTTPVERMRINSAGTIRMNAYADGTMSFTGGNGTITSSSDSRLKQEVARVKPGLQEILQVVPKHFKWLNEIESVGTENATTHLGFFAQDLLSLIPEAVGKPSVEGGMYGLYDRPLIAALVKAVQELSTKNDELEARIVVLETP